ncbi:MULTISPECIES: hypothetical protein [Serratia]|nr:hypothetical protein [Serratia marcescens]
MEARRVATASRRHAQHDSAPGRPGTTAFAKCLVKQEEEEEEEEEEERYP